MSHHETGPAAGWKLRYLFADCTLDTDRRELRRGADLISVEPQVFDLLEYVIRNRNRVVSKVDLVAAIWHGRIVSESALATRQFYPRHRASRRHRPAALPYAGESIGSGQDG